MHDGKPTVRTCVVALGTEPRRVEGDDATSSQGAGDALVTALPRSAFCKLSATRNAPNRAKERRCSTTGGTTSLCLMAGVRHFPDTSIGIEDGLAGLHRAVGRSPLDHAATGEAVRSETNRSNTAA